MATPPPFLCNPLFKEPVLTIQRQPQKRGYRFRYSSEGLTHGGIRGEAKTGEREGRIYPTIKLCGYRGRAKVVLTIVTANKNSTESPHLHAHSLIVNKEKTKGYHVYNLDVNHPILELSTVAIQHVVKEKLLDTLMDRILQSRFLQKFGSSISVSNFDAQQFADLTTFTDALQDKEEIGSFTHRETKKEVVGEELTVLRKQALELSKTMDMNKCRLSFQVFLQDKDGHFSRKLEPVYSDVIFDGKTKHGAALKIMRISKVTSTVCGDEEVWLIADKLHADDLEVRFFEEPLHAQFSHSWEGFGKFQKTDVLKQICLIFRTPEYHDKSIEQPVSVNMQLRRKSDPHCISDPQPFKYTPIVDRYGIGEKRRKEIPMGEILGFSQSMKKRPVESATFTSLPLKTNNQMTFNFPNTEFPTNVNMFSGNPTMNTNMVMNYPATVTSSTLNLGSSALNFGTPRNNMNVSNSIAVSGINFPISAALDSRHIQSSTAVHPNNVGNRSSLTNHSMSTTSTLNTNNPAIKEEGEEAAVLKNETAGELMDCNETDTKDHENDHIGRRSENTVSVSNDLSMFANFEGQSESMINFLMPIYQSEGNYY